MRGVIIAPAHNTPGKADATGAFQIGARQFRLLHSLEAPVLFNNNAAASVRRQEVIDAVTNAAGPLDVVAYFGHGLVNELSSARIGITHVNDLADAIRGNTRSSAVILLYACSSGAFGGFAERLSGSLNSGYPSSQRLVFGHTNSGHSFWNPNVTRFPDARYVIEPGSSFWPHWRNRLRNTNLWARFPFMTEHQLLEALGGEPEWESWLRKPSSATRVKIHGGGVIGVFRTEREANTEKGADRPWSNAGGWECWIRKGSSAVHVKLYGGGMIAVYQVEDKAISENREEALAGRAPRGVWRKVRLP